jgi:hypothetical protein
MMNAAEIIYFRRFLDIHDPENRDNRRAFHENYEWLEGYWRSQFGENYFDQVWKKYGAYYWENVPKLKNIAQVLAGLRPVGNNENPGYDPTHEVEEATKLLLALNKTPQLHFRALMIVIRQIRNNLFHGGKMELEGGDQYNRNKQLVILAKDTTNSILEKLEEAERTCP